MTPARLLLAAAVLLPCYAQKVYVYSPLTRVDPAGEVVKADRGTAEPRHVLSPGVPRNGFSSLRVVIELEKPGNYIVDIGQNPDDAVKATLYKEVFVETADGWIPDSLQQVKIPYKGFATDFRLPNQRVVSFWLDMWVDRKSVIDRVKVEPQLWDAENQDWVIYPMEVRIQQPVLPNMKVTYTPDLPPLTAPADAVVWGAIRSALCGAPPQKAGLRPQQLTARDLLRRNALQHMLLATDPVQLHLAFSKASGFSDPKAWCVKPSTPAAGPEWYLRFRDLIYRAAGATD